MQRLCESGVEKEQKEEHAQKRGIRHGPDVNRWCGIAESEKEISIV